MRALRLISMHVFISRHLRTSLSDKTSMVLLRTNVRTAAAMLQALAHTLATVDP
jgi:hypothetical protein